jgi:hypothetical protein
VELVAVDERDVPEDVQRRLMEGRDPDAYLAELCALAAQMNAARFYVEWYAEDVQADLATDLPLLLVRLPELARRLLEQQNYEIPFPTARIAFSWSPEGDERLRIGVRDYPSEREPSEIAYSTTSEAVAMVRSISTTLRALAGNLGVSKSPAMLKWLRAMPEVS